MLIKYEADNKKGRHMFFARVALDYLPGLITRRRSSKPSDYKPWENW
jgi:hypothetical protein